MKILLKDEAKQILGGAVWDAPALIAGIIRLNNAATQMKNAIKSRDDPNAPADPAGPKGDKLRGKATNKQPGLTAKSGTLESKGVTVVNPR